MSDSFYKTHKSKIQAGVALTALALSPLIMWLLSGAEPDNRPPSGYYYDLGTGKTFVMAINDVLPIRAPSQSPQGNEAGLGVKAYVFTCESCDKEAKRFVGWLETHNPNAVAEFDQGPGKEMSSDGHRNAGALLLYLKLHPQGVLVGLPSEVSGNEIKWYASASEEAGMLRKLVNEKCAGTNAKRCEP